MNALATTTSFECAIPDWLQNCLTAQLESEPGSDRPLADPGLICRAFDFAYQLHQGQYRKSGEPYICHPVAVAGLLRDLGAVAP